MKKRINTTIALLTTFSLLLTGCSLSKSDVDQAKEYLSDNQEADAETNDDAASSASSIIVINDLFEPILEEKENLEAATEASSEDAEPEESNNDENDPVNIVFFGDSQLANGREDGSDIPALLGSKIPNSRIYNMAIGGTTASVEKTTNDLSPENLSSYSFYGMALYFAGEADRNEALASVPSVLDTMNSIDPKDVDYYVLSYGTNDFLNNVYLDASDDDTDPVKDHSLLNAYSHGIETLQSISPNAEIIMMLPFYGIYVAEDGTYIGDSYIVSNGIGTLADYADKVKNVAEGAGATIFDGMFMTRCDLYLDTASQYLMDNLHLSLTGRQIVARLLAHNINFAEGNEPYAYLDTDYIKIAEFDPNETYRYDEGLMKEYYPESWSSYIKGEYPLAQPSEEAAAEYNSGN